MLPLHRRRHVVLVAAVLAAEVLTAFVVSSTALVVAGALVAAMLALLLAPWLMPVVVVPGVWMLGRVGSGSLDLSVSDALLVAGAAVSLAFVPWKDERVRRAAWCVAGYLGVLAIAVASHPTRRAGLELLHRGVLVGGSIAVGSAIAALGRVTVALRLLVGVSSVFALRAIADAASTGFDPAYPFGVQKNAAGGLLAMVIVIVMLAPSESASPTPLRLATIGVLAAGTLATQSRGAAIALVVVSLIVAVTRGRRPGLRVFAVVCALAATSFVLSSFDDVGIGDSENRFSSYNSRRLTNEYALDQWRASPITGVGLRFFRDPDFVANATAAGESTFGEPHSMVVSNLAESGIIGTAGLAWLLVALIRLTRRHVTPLATAATCVLITRVVHAQFDIWWVAGTVTLPFTMIGMALGSRARAPRGSGVEAATATRVPAAR